MAVDEGWKPAEDSMTMRFDPSAVKTYSCLKTGGGAAVPLLAEDSGLSV